MGATCAALHITSPIPLNASSVNEYLNTALVNVRLQRLLAFSETTGVHGTIDSASRFIRRNRGRAQLVVVVIDFLLLESEVSRLSCGEVGTAQAAWRQLPARELARLFDCYRVYLEDGTPQLEFGDDCLSSFKIFCGLANILDRDAVVVLNMAAIRVSFSSLLHLFRGAPQRHSLWIFTYDDDRSGGGYLEKFIRSRLWGRKENDEAHN